jgi:NAD(P)-dependent dehydrogenase (short-subunit alcohol dehydrogenase family)
MNCQGQSPTLVLAGVIDSVAVSLARLAVARGWRVAVVVAPIDEPPGLDAVPVHVVDLTKADAVEAIFSMLTSDWGRPPDALVYSAHTGRSRAAVTETAEGWDAAQARHLRAAFVVAQAGAREMLRLRGGLPVDDGSVVFVGDVSAVRSLPGYGNVSMNAAVSGMAGMTRQLATEWGPFGIRVNMVQLGVTEESSVRSAEMMRRVPLGRAGQAEELAESCYYLISRSSSYVTGVTLPVDGGFLAT